VLATIVALTLNLAFRIGIRRTVTTSIDPADPDSHDVTNFIEDNAGAWGARRDVTNRLEFAVQQTIEAVIEFTKVSRPVKVDISYDEFMIEAAVSYVGLPLQFPKTAPSKEEILESEDGALRLSGFLIWRYADKIAVSESNGVQTIKLHFDH
jgi:NCS2 family nucleobase:cation symporter-2